jgi:hypothetical protein
VAVHKATGLFPADGKGGQCPSLSAPTQPPGNQRAQRPFSGTELLVEVDYDKGASEALPHPPEEQEERGLLTMTLATELLSSSLPPGQQPATVPAQSHSPLDAVAW